ncbi:hypothetical protein JCM33374_g721 [Metschnikowia sp. JCM 33374]|nr:hypothetical protein JCM33374_g721 [Metschnikowia sp. JCM 33374]
MMMAILAEKHFDAFHKSVKKCIEIGRALQDGKDTTKVSRKLSISKQTYDANSPNIRNSANDSIYKIHFPYKRKLLTQPARVVGSIIAFVPKKEHIVRYETPYIFTPSADFDTEKLAKLKARIDLEYVSTENDNKATRPPEIRGVAAKIMICTVRSKKYPIPIEISQEMKFRNIPGKNDSVENYVVAPFKTYLEEMSKFIGAYGTHQLGISKQLLVDVKSLANLESKTTSLKVDNITVHTKGGLGQWKESTNNNKAEKSIQIDVDIQSLFIKDSKRTIDDTLNGALALVPSFQSCIMCRYYYLLVEIKLGNGDIMPVKIPFRVSK